MPDASRWLRAHLWLVYAFLYLPILVLMGLSFNRGGMPTAWTGFSTAWYGKLIASPQIVSSAVNTLIVAAVSTAIATALGTLLALGVERRRQSNALDALLFAPMIIPDIVLAISLLSFYTLLGFSLGLHSIILSHVVFNIAFVCAIVRTRLKHFDYSVVEASIDLGASEFTTFRRVTLPMIWPGVLAGAMLAFTLSVDEFIIAFFLTGTEPTMPVYIWSQLRFTSKLPSVVALGCVLLLLSLTLLFAAEYFRRRSNRRTGSEGSATGGMM